MWMNRFHIVLCPYTCLLSSVDFTSVHFICPGVWGQRAGLHCRTYQGVYHNLEHRISAWLMPTDLWLSDIVIVGVLCPAAGLAKWDPADPASPGVATADRRGHTHFGAARNCDSWDHGRHPAAGRLEVSRHRRGWDGRLVHPWPRGQPGWPVPESPAL